MGRSFRNRCDLPIDGRRAWYPAWAEGNSDLSHARSVAVELDVERDLFPWVAAAVVYRLSPYGEGAQCLQVSGVLPPAVSRGCAAFASAEHSWRPRGCDCRAPWHRKRKLPAQEHPTDDGTVFLSPRAVLRLRRCAT
jgi:hypothetical protein